MWKPVMAVGCAVLLGAVTDFCPPCGICRQVMREFSDPKAFRVYLRKSPTEFKSCTLEELLPESFGPDQLADTSR